MKTNHTLAIARSPHIQIYEGLTELLGFIARMNNKLEIVCTVGGLGNENLWKTNRVTYTFVTPKKRKLGIPTAIKLFSVAVFKAIMNRPNMVVGCDTTGNIVSAFVHRLLGIPFVYYGLELPCLKQPHMTIMNKLEHWSIRSANIIVTMDEHHAKFICEQTGASRERCAILPNSTSGPLNDRKNDILRKRFSMKDDDILLLHAGGIGAAQQSVELAKAAQKWNSHYHIIFHAHCRMDSEPYFQQFSQTLQETKNVHLNNEPVPKEALDDLVSSADIGIAWYDHELLGYRAELLGLAAGKIGRYLKNGVPVIARNLFSIKEYLDKYECGISVNRVEDISAAIEKINNDYERYSKNSLRCYEELWKPDRYLIDIQKRIENILQH